MDMKKYFLSFAFCMAGVIALSAQNVDKSLVSAKADETAKAAEELRKLDTAGKKWHFTGVVGTNAAATGLVNWSAGGKNNVNGVAFAKLRLLWKKDNFAWDTNLDTEYGLSWIDQDEDPLQKSSDKINLSTKFGWEFSKSWYLTVLGGFQSQYATGFEYKTGYNPVISRWLAPAYTDFFNTPSDDKCDVVPVMKDDPDDADSYILEYNVLRFAEDENTSIVLTDDSDGSEVYTLSIPGFIDTYGIEVDSRQEALLAIQITLGPVGITVEEWNVEDVTPGFD